MQRTFRTLHVTAGYGQLLRLREVHNRYRSGYAAVTGVVMPPGVHQRAASTGYAQVTHGYMTPL